MLRLCRGLAAIVFVGSGILAAGCTTRVQNQPNSDWSAASSDSSGSSDASGTDSTKYEKPSECTPNVLRYLASTIGQDAIERLQTQEQLNERCREALAEQQNEQAHDTQQQLVDIERQRLQLEKDQAAGQHPKQAIGAACKTADQCVRLRIGLQRAGLDVEPVCVMGMDGTPICTFPCDAEGNDDLTTRLHKLCTALKRQCVSTEKDAPETCQSQ